MSESESPAEPVSRLSLKALGLKPGMALQTRRLVEGARKKESQYFGAIEGKGVMVGPLGPEGVQTELEEGEVCVVRGFTGIYEYSFLSKVLQTFEKPFAYALLAYPAQVDARQVRQSMRTRVSWPSVVRLPGVATPVAVTLIDLSLYGAMFRSELQLAAIGAPLELTLSAELDGVATEIQLSASVCHNNRSSTDTAYYVGVAFKSLTQQDKLLLHYLTQGTQA